MYIARAAGRRAVRWAAGRGAANCKVGRGPPGISNIWLNDAAPEGLLKEFHLYIFCRPEYAGEIKCLMKATGLS